MLCATLVDVTAVGHIYLTFLKMIKENFQVSSQGNL